MLNFFFPTKTRHRHHRRPSPRAIPPTLNTNQTQQPPRWYTKCNHPLPSSVELPPSPKPFASSGSPRPEPSAPTSAPTAGSSKQPPPASLPWIEGSLSRLRFPKEIARSTVSTAPCARTCTRVFEGTSTTISEPGSRTRAHAAARRWMPHWIRSSIECTSWRERSIGTIWLRVTRRAHGRFRGRVVSNRRTSITSLGRMGNHVNPRLY
ncbi:hypothetical protein B0T14DRAFT_255308 [Immersiella caudata]|uniref:Uncharacterized protein n=1 Tax=Immersiella caudata TaxID=314043 RepID=A0AA40BX42_9PEZI|nr:hypothetical protein B0T14DRAFT_255308 [Immersiella caudata]